MIFSFGTRGLITYELLGLKGVTVYGLVSTLSSEILTYFPIAYLTLRPLLAAIDSNLEGMALSLGDAPASRSSIEQRQPPSRCGGGAAALTTVTILG